MASALLAVALLMEPVFRILSWECLQRAMRSFVLLLSGCEGGAPGFCGLFVFSVGGIPYEMTARCTYADLLCLTTPPLLRFRGIAADLLRVAGWWVIILATDGIRILAACKMGCVPVVLPVIGVTRCHRKTSGRASHLRRTCTQSRPGTSAWPVNLAVLDPRRRSLGSSGRQKLPLWPQNKWDTPAKCTRVVYRGFGRTICPIMRFDPPSSSASL